MITEQESPRPVGLLVVDETLRDGLQSASARDPSLEQKIEILHAMVSIGVDRVSVGLPAAGPRVVEHGVGLAREIARAKLPVVATAAARTTEGDVRAIEVVSQRAGVPIDVYAFLGCSPIRCYVEGWGIEFLTERIRVAGETARRASLLYCVVLEDTTRTPPDKLRTLFSAAVDAGAERVCLCDTCGHADPHGARALVRFARSTLDDLGAQRVGLDWHGHNDRGLALANALAATTEGVTGVHGTAGGIGERCGNTAMEPLLVNLGARGAHREPCTRSLDAYSRLTAGAISGASPTTERVVTREPRVPLRLTVNGDVVDRAARPSQTLLELLREDLDLVGTRQGCDKGDCGACAVLLDGEPALSCLTLALSCEGREVTTVEALKGVAALDPLLDAFDRVGGGQCGFCTPGMLVTAKALLSRTPRPTREAIREAISGNLCRCTGYGPIVDAIELAAQIARGEAPEAPALPGAECAPAPIAPHVVRRS